MREQKFAPLKPYDHSSPGAIAQSPHGRIQTDSSYNRERADINEQCSISKQRHEIGLIHLAHDHQLQITCWLQQRLYDARAVSAFSM